MKAADGRGGYSRHSYHQTKQDKKQIEEVLPEIIHNPPLQIKSTEDFYITARIKNLGNSIPIIYYRFEGDKKFYKRAMRKSPSEDFQFMILGAALTGDYIEYYIQAATGSRVTASLGDESNPINVGIIAPKTSSKIMYLFVFAGVAGLVIKVLSSANKKKKQAIKTKDKTRVTKAVGKTTANKSRAKMKLSARAR
jgi:hypothetical protein